MNYQTTMKNEQPMEFTQMKNKITKPQQQEKGKNKITIFMEYLSANI